MSGLLWAHKIFISYKSVQYVIRHACHRYYMQKSRSKDKMDKLNPKIEKILEDIDSGKIKTTRYKTVDEYLKHVDEILSE
jgi:hypothetical protein